MKPLELTSAITALANILACGHTADEVALLSVILVQLSDTLATIATLKEINESSENILVD